jgi:FkbM family methyltransferase
MSFISYAQNLEDVILFRALHHVEHGFYIDVGAQHPVVDSVTKAFYDRGWHGISIEPVSEYFQLLQKERTYDINLNTAVCDRQGEVTFYTIPHTGISTIDKVNADDYLIKGYEVIEQVIPCTTLDAICIECKVNTVHFLKIDAEGAEKTILKGFSFQTVRPWVVVVEANEPGTKRDTSQEWEHILLDHGYEFLYYDGLNRFYLATEHSELREYFHTPPNVFDEYIVYSHYFAQQKLAEINSQKEVLDKQLADLSSKYEALSTNLAEEFVKKVAFEKQLADLSSKYEALSTNLAEEFVKKEALVRQLADQTLLLQQISNSLSWRFTSPLRKIRNMLNF